MKAFAESQILATRFGKEMEIFYCIQLISKCSMPLCKPERRNGAVVKSGELNMSVHIVFRNRSVYAFFIILRGTHFLCACAGYRRISYLLFTTQEQAVRRMISCRGVLN